VALASALSGKEVRPDVAMTGEITLRGKVLPVGGIKEKVLAAKSAGIKEFVLPKRNQPALHEIPDRIKKGIQFVFIDTIDEALRVAFSNSTDVPGSKKLPRRKKTVERKD
jgi:ATP-dependent Lon protease